MLSSEKQMPIVLSSKARSLEPGLSLCSTTRVLELCLASALFSMGLHPHSGLLTPLPIHLNTFLLSQVTMQENYQALGLTSYNGTHPFHKTTSISLCDFLIRDRMHSRAAAWGAKSDNVRYPVNAESRQDFNSTLSLMKL